MNTLNSSAQKQWLASPIVVITGFALIKLILHLLTNAFDTYGYFRDELYYVVCSDNLAPGYVDQPPLSLFFLAANRMLFGDSLFALRLLPAFLGTLTVFLTGLMAKELGGKLYALSLACLASIFSLSFLASCSYYSMNSFDLLCWSFTSYLLLKLINTEKSVYWFPIGITLGFGLLNKTGVLWLGFGIFAGLIFTRERRWLKTSWPWGAGCLALLLFLPYIIWNFQHDFAHLEFIRNATAGKYSSQNAMTFLSGQMLQQNPVLFPLWLLGLWYLMMKADKKYRLLSIVFCSAAAILLINGHSKAEYLSPAYAVLFAAGAVFLEQLFSSKRTLWLRYAFVLLILLSAMLFPVVLAVLPVESFIAYSERLGITPSSAEGKRLESLPQFYADRFGWKEKAKAVADVYHALSPEDQAKCAIVADNYGRCAAIDFFGKQYNIPKTIGTHNNYWIWGPRNYTGEILIVLGGDLEDKQQSFQTVEVAGTVTTPYCMPYENNLRIYVCRGLKGNIDEAWSRKKHYI
ncbi:MAG: glycosyltransferase family 39 protein [bacterium]